MPPTRPGPPPDPRRQAASLALVRLGMVAGVLLLGALAWWRAQEGVPPLADEARGQVDTLLAVMWGVGVAGAAVLRILWGRARSGRRQRTLSVLGWAFGEIPALAGGIHYWLTGDPGRYLPGVLFLVFTLFLFSRPRESHG